MPAKSKNAAPDHMLWIISEKLSDGSKVFNVEFEGTKFACVTEGDAADLAEAIAEAINDHSNATAGVMY